MKLLALDTATEACTVALWLDGEVLERVEPGSQHSERILLMVDALLADAGLVLTQLDALAFGRGPGSFTGLRIGAGVTQGLAFGADLPVVPVSSLAALAQGVDAPKVLAAFDARMHQVYWGAYQRGPEGLVTPVMAEAVVEPAQAPLPAGHVWVVAGSGWDAYKSIWEPRIRQHGSIGLSGVVPHARDVAILATAQFQAGEVVAPEFAVPIYIRDDVAKKQGTR
jgi:tRNA threonylcarbamoyladenosine biosynthesis protein TsaB